MFKSSDLSPAGPCIIITSAAHQSAAERATFEMAEVISLAENTAFSITLPQERNPMSGRLLVSS